MAARSLNKVLLIGNLTRDPELRYTPSGTAVATFGLATNREWSDQSGQRQEEVEFHNIVAWNKLAEICSQLLYKGRKIYVEGRLSTRNWTNQEGQERRVTEVVIEEMIAFGPGKKGEEEKNDVDFGASHVTFGNKEKAAPAEVEIATQEIPAEPTANKDVADDIPF
jgi:single-strand DNA-binding protein